MAGRIARGRKTLQPDIRIPTETATEFARVFADPVLATEVGTALSCIEAEALAKLLTALGAPSAAELWIEEHTPSDEPGDAHFRGSPPH